MKYFKNYNSLDIFGLNFHFRENFVIITLEKIHQFMKQGTRPTQRKQPQHGCPEWDSAARVVILTCSAV